MLVHFCAYPVEFLTIFLRLQDSDPKSAFICFCVSAAINCVSFTWDVTNSSIAAQVNGSTHVTAENRTGNANFLAVEKDRVNVQMLYPGESYNVSLWYELDSVRLLQCSHLLTLGEFTCSVLDCAADRLIFSIIYWFYFCFSFKLVPNSVHNLRCDYFSGGYGLAVTWVRPNGVVDVVQVYVDRQHFNVSSSDISPRHEVKSLQAAQWYKVTATSFSGAMKSKTESLDCQTDPRGKIRSKYV